MYPATTLLFIDGAWTLAAAGATLPVLNPATGTELARVAHAGTADIERALAAAVRGFGIWRKTPARERSRLLNIAADRLLARCDEIARLITLEQGKPVAEAQSEVRNSCEVLRWFAEEGTRVYGRLIAPRVPDTMQRVEKQPLGPVAAFTPWNYPVAQAVRKVAAALAAGCSVVLKGAEEAPASCAALVDALAEAGIPPGVLNLLYGEPAQISSYLVARPEVRKVTFTGSSAVGKQLAGLAGAHMKRVTMELGGHAPAIVCADADVEHAATLLAAHKFHNAGQSCIAPTRILVQRPVATAFTEAFVQAAAAIVTGDGSDPATVMGPLANPRRVQAMHAISNDAAAKGARLLLGGEAPARDGFFFAPTVFAEVPLNADLMNEEPFGPIAAVNGFDDLEQAIAEANRLPYGLAAYAFTRSQLTAARLADDIETGMLSVNEYGLAYAEVPFNGVKDSGYGSEGGSEAIETFLTTKFVSQRHL
ncbi:NAD-dependent succinate-semialdehyde dehydrogenase [Verticiella sediminum]|uniref:NAD-dependent succinate-semialdehyde dehydrogenase n=1 Tax=Verticiella sediminum TaxID=1247510 RepID=A0A556AU34_9BURK|nr:NAD-dependent succinate-semialdehyde dehydrogenase [Verticiella sediminum]TSH96430.1 NAD-dependent succinate-semialdehyde dehydrogenase [Verticiella sediminum]